MKKRFLPILLVFSIILSLLPAAAFAEGEGPTVTIDSQIVVGNGEIVGGFPAGVSYSEGSRTLTLSNASIGTLRIEGSELTIVLDGDSVIRDGGGLLYPNTDQLSPFAAFETALTIKGPGSLLVDSTGSEAEQTFVLGFAELTVTGGAALTVCTDYKDGPGAFGSVSSNFIMDGGSSLDVEAANGIWIDFNSERPMGGSYSFSDCTIRANSIKVEDYYETGFENLVVVGDGADITLGSSEDWTGFSTGNVLEIGNASRFLIDGGEVLVDIPAVNDDYTPGCVCVFGQTGALELRRGVLEAKSIDQHCIILEDGGTLTQTGGVLTVSSTGEARGNSALFVHGGSAVLKGGITTLNGFMGVFTSTPDDYDGCSSLSVDGAEVNISGAGGPAFSVADASLFTLLDGEVTATVSDGYSRTAICGAGSRLYLLGGTLHLKNEGRDLLFEALDDNAILLGAGMTATDDVTGDPLAIDDQFRRLISGTAVTISGGKSVGVYSCDMNITSGEVTQGARFDLRADMSLGAEEGQVSFTLPEGVSYVPGSLTIDGWSAQPDSASPLTITLRKGGTVRFSAVAEMTGSRTLAASITSEGQSHRETLDFNVSAFNLSLPDATARLTLPVKGTALPNSSITFYEGSEAIGSASSNSLGTWAGAITLPDVVGVHTVYARITPASGGSFSSEEHEITYDPALNEVKTLTVTNRIHGRTDADEPMEEKLVIDFITGQDSSDYYTYWPELPTFEFRVDFVEESSNLGSVTVVTADRNGNETRIPLRYHQAQGAWMGSHDFDDKSTPRRFRVEYSADGIDGGSSEYTYDENGNIASVSDNGRTVRISYDQQGRIDEAFLSDGSVIHFTYNTSGEIIQATDGEYTISFDSPRQFTVKDADGNSYIVEYTLENGISCITSSADGSVSFSYDEEGRLVQETGEDYTRYYSYEGDTTTVQDSTGLELKIEPGESNEAHVISARMSGGSPVKYTYGSDSRLISVTDGNGRVTEYSHDEQGNVAAIGYPDGKHEYFSYDSSGSMTAHIDRSGVTTAYTYNENGTLAQITYDSGETTAYTYDEDGNLVSITEDGQTTALFYDSLNRMNRIVYPNGETVSYTFDDMGRLTSVSDGVSVTKYEYDSQGQLAVLTDGKNARITYTHDENGNLIKQQNSNGTYTEYTYEGGRLASIRNHDAAGQLLSSFGYEYDDSGNLISLATVEGVWRYDYDEAGQIIRSTSPAGQVTQYTYDDAGNRTLVIAEGIQTRYSSNSVNQYTEYGDVSRTYDDNGNLLTETRDGETAKYTWDVRGRLTGFVNFDGTEYSFGYDAFGLRNQISVNGDVTRFLNDPAGFGYAIASYHGGEEIHYLPGNTLAAAVIGEQAYYYHANLLGSVSEITDPDGTAVNRYTYDQEGNVVTRQDGIYNPYTYAGIYGLVNDGNGLIYDRTRYISAATGSYISMDQAGQNYDLNLYRYASNDAVSLFDITGYEPLSSDELFEAMNRIKPMPNDTFESSTAPSNTAGVKVNPSNTASGIKTGGQALDNGLNRLTEAGKAVRNSSKFPAGRLPNSVFSYPYYKFPYSGRILFCNGLPTVLLVAGAFVDKDTHPHIYNILNDPILLIASLFLPKAPPIVWGIVIGVVLLREFLPIIIDKGIEMHEKHRTPDRSKKMIEDPSGYVYEGIPSNRLEGVTTTIYFSASETKPTGNASESQRWHAAEFGQVNPLSTDSSGQYMWMVPDGWWQVKYEKAGYDTVWSDWLPVPPVQTEVNVSMTSSAPAALALSGDADSGSVILRFSRPVRLDSVNSGTVHLTRNGAALSGELIPVDAGIADDNQICATVFELTPEGQPVRSGDVLTASFSGVVTYAGTTSSGSASATGAREMPFDDVRASDYFYDPVLWASRHTPQIAAGTSATAFSPNDSCTRAQAVTLLWRAMGQPEPTTNVCPFRDVTPGAYYYKAILWAAEKGIATGTAADAFSPDAACSRAQIVTFLHRAEGTPRSTESASKFKDVDSSAYYYNAVLWAAQWGIATGTDVDAFSPDQICTRGQIVTFLFRDMK